MASPFPEEKATTYHRLYSSSPGDHLSSETINVFAIEMAGVFGKCEILMTQVLRQD